MNFIWNELKNGCFPKDENEVLVTVIYGEDGIMKKEVCMSAYHKDYQCWDTNNFLVEEGIVIAWSEMPKPCLGTY